MAEKGIVFDQDVKLLITLLLRQHAISHNDFRRHNNAALQLSFEVANRGLGALGAVPEQAAKSPEEKQ